MINENQWEYAVNEKRGEAINGEEHRGMNSRGETPNEEKCNE